MKVQDGHQLQRDTLFELTGLRYVKEVKAPLLVLARSHHLWGYIVCTIWSGLFDVVWAQNLPFGVGTSFVCFAIMTAADMCLALCLAEMISAIPAAGGILGFGRLALGHLVGFLCGVIECLGFLTSVALAAMMWAGYVQDIFLTSDALTAVWCLLIFCASFALIMIGGKTMWNFFFLGGILTLLLILLYLISAMVHGNFNQNAYLLSTDDATLTAYSKGTWFRGGANAFYVTLPSAFWIFGGVETTSIIGEETCEVQFAILSSHYLLLLSSSRLKQRQRELFSGHYLGILCTFSCYLLECR